MEVKNIMDKGSHIDMEINHPVYGWIPFTASADDSEELGRDLYAKALAGEYGQVQEVKAEEIAAEDKENQLTEAKQYLLETDWIVIKINEIQVEGGDVAPLIVQYASELQKRKEARGIINSLQVK